MTNYDHSYAEDKVYGVLQSIVEDGQIMPPPELIIKPISFIQKLINGFEFKSGFIQTEAFTFTYFRTKEEAEEYQDALSRPMH